MAWLAYVGMALQAFGQYDQGQSAKIANLQRAQAAEFEALQQDERAKAEVASSQRAALNEKRQSDYAQSRAVAVAQGGAGDPTVVDILSDLAAEGSYRSAVALYEGQARARQARMGATAARYEASGYRQAGADAAQAGTIGAATTIFSGMASGYSRGDFRGGGSLYGKYGSMPSQRSMYEPYRSGTRLPSADTPGLGPYN